MRGILALLVSLVIAVPSSASGQWYKPPKIQPGYGPPSGQPRPPGGMPPPPSYGPAPVQELFAANLGMVSTPIRYADGTFGARVTRPPDPGTPAATLGLEPGDVLVMLDGQRFRTPDDVLAHRAQTSVTLVNVRTNALQTMTVMLP